MKKSISLLLIALMMITVLFVTISCSQEQEPEETGVTLTFDTKGGSKLAAITVEPGTKIKKSQVKTTKKEGYVFLGWYAEETYKTEVTFPRVLNESMTVYAKWQDSTSYEHSDPILPAGSVALNNRSFEIPLNWSSDGKGYSKTNGQADLPEVIYSFSGDRTSVTNVSDELKAAIAYTKEHPDFFDETPKNIIFLFSDGWGVSGINMSREYKGELIMDYLPYATESKTDSYLKYQFIEQDLQDVDKDDNRQEYIDLNDYTSHTTTDSCAGGTQVLCGYKTRYGYIALDVDANPVENLIEAAHRMGYKTANVTNDNIVDATPSDAMIHDTNRYHSDVLYYKALKYALAEQGLDLLMGWDWGMSRYFNDNTWAEKFLAAEKEGVKDAIDEMDLETKYDGGDPIAYFKSLSTEEKAKMAGFSIYYHLWEKTTGNLNSFQKWTTTGAAELSQYLSWLGNGGAGSGLATAIASIQSSFANPSDYVVRYTTFKEQVEDNNFTKPRLGSWTGDSNNYDSATPNRGYLMSGSYGTNYPSWPEMVAYTLYQMDKEADEADTGFFCIIENTCTDGWGHSKQQEIKIYAMMNEIQCFDEGVAIAVKYVLEHPDTLLVVSADHETGGYKLREGWENDYTLISATTTGHSSQRVPLYAFGAGAQNFSAEAIATKYAAMPQAGLEDGGKIHEGWITGQIMGELLTTGSSIPFGEQAGYKGQVFETKNDDPYGNSLWNPTGAKE